jgi:acyl-CoA synthetase (NDP forming)
MQEADAAPAGDLFAPKVVAIIGASAAPNALTARPLRFLKRHGFPGALYAVNPRYDHIDDVACYRAVDNLPEPPDTALIGVPAASVEAAVADCCAAGVALISIFTAGIPSEASRRIVAMAKARGTRVLGPNSLGFINAHARVACTYSQAALLDHIPQGALSIVSQSGGLGGCLLNRVVDEGLGIDLFLTSGMGIDLDIPALFEHLASAVETRVVAAIIESIADGERLIRAVERLHVAGKRLVVCRIGGSAAGRSMTVSHTGALASDARIFSAVCRGLGVPLVKNLDELLEVAAACTARAQPVGPCVGIVTSSGGAAIMVADALEAQGLVMPPLSRPAIESLQTKLPAIATISNPLDIGAGQGASAFRAALAGMLSEPIFNSVVAALTMVTGDQADQAVPELIHAARSSSRPLSVLWLAGSLAAEWRQKLRANGIAVFKSPGGAASALRKLQLQPRRRRSAQMVSPVAPAARACVAGDAGARSEWRTRQMLTLYGFQSPREVLARSREQAILAAQDIGGPVALKVQSRLLPHRAAAGALLLNLDGEDAVGSGYDRLMARLDPAVKEVVEGVLVQAMVKPEHEVLLGVLRDPVFGPVVACSPGGSAAEKQSGVTFIMPDEDRDAVAALLSGKEIGRQIGPTGVATITDLILRQLVTDLGPLLAELDINPVALVCGGTQAIVLDALARIGSDQT